MAPCILLGCVCSHFLPFAIQTHRSAFERAACSPVLVQNTYPRAWLAAIDSFWNSSGKSKAADSTVAALDGVLARFGLWRNCRNRQRRISPVFWSDCEGILPLAQ